MDGKNDEAIELVSDLFDEKTLREADGVTEPEDGGDVDLSSSDYILSPVRNEYDDDNEEGGFPFGKPVIITAAGVLAAVIAVVIVLVMMSKGINSNVTYVKTTVPPTDDSTQGTVALITEVNPLAVTDDEAEKIEALINSIGEVTLESGGKISAARSAYDKSIKAVRKNVGNLDVLTAAEERYARLRADKVRALIEKIDTESSDCKKQISAAKKAYNALTEAERALVANYSDIAAAEKELQRLEEASRAEQESEEREERLRRRQEALSVLTLRSSPNAGDWYYPSVMPMYINERTYVLPYIGVSGDNAALCLSADYAGEEYINWHTLQITIDGVVYIKRCDLSKFERNNSDESVWESFSDNAEESDAAWLKAAAESSVTEITFVGDAVSSVYYMSAEDKTAIAQVLNAFDSFSTVEEETE